MARARNIKPGFFANEDLVELSFGTRLLFIGLWTLADREGRLEDRPKRIKMNLFPADDININEALNELQQGKFISRYEVEGTACIQIDQFTKHQNPHHMEAPSLLPAKPGTENRYNHTPISPKQRARIYERDGHKCVQCDTTENLQIDHIQLVSNGGTGDDDNLRTLCAQCNNKRSKKQESGANPADSLIPDSLIPDTGLQGSTAPQAAPAAPKKSRRPSKVPLPTDFQISESVRAWAEEKGHNHIERHLESFLVKVRAKGYVYADWDAAFQNAIADDWAKLGSQAQARASPGTARPEKFDPSAYVNRNRTKVSDERTIEFNEHGEPV